MTVMATGGAIVAVLAINALTLKRANTKKRISIFVFAAFQGALMLVTPEPKWLVLVFVILFNALGVISEVIGSIVNRARIRRKIGWMTEGLHQRDTKSIRQQQAES